MSRPYLYYHSTSPSNRIKPGHVITTNEYRILKWCVDIADEMREYVSDESLDGFNKDMQMAYNALKRISPFNKKGGTSK